MNDANRTSGGERVWECLCICGKVTFVTVSNLTGSNTRSCGCLHGERTSAAKRTHGLSGSTEHVVWTSMIGRCTNPNNDRWSRYGGRGIKVCDRWRRSFAAFLADVGPRPSDRYSLGRIDNDDGYHPGNVRWETVNQQVANKSNNVILEHDGNVCHMFEMARRYNVKPQILSRRLSEGWPLGLALTQPTKRKRKEVDGAVDR